MTDTGGVGGLEGARATSPVGMEGDDFDQVEQIGHGGFGIVYRARQKAFNRVVAIKVLSGSRLDPDTLGRFERERQAIGALSGHPNIVDVYASGFTDSGQPYMVMDHMSGGSLADQMAEGRRLEWKEAVRVGTKIAGALETAHRAGVLHRDLKPENILFSPYGEPQLADFGIASVASVEGGADSETDLTASLLHAPPEVLNGQPSTAASDVYSLGSTIFTVLWGSAPFLHPTDETTVAVMARIHLDPVPDLRPQGVPHDVCQALERAMAKEPARRQASAAELGRELRQAQRNAGLAPTEMVLLAAGSDDDQLVPEPLGPESVVTSGQFPGPPTTYRPPPLPPQPLAPARDRSVTRLAAAAAVLVSVVGVAAFLVLGSGSPSPSSTVAGDNLERGLLNASELGTGWAPADAVDVLAESNVCGITPTHLAQISNQARRSFLNAQEAKQVQEEVARFQPGEAKAFVDDLRSAADSCDTWEDTREDGSVAHVEKQRVDGPELADQTLRYFVTSTDPASRTPLAIYAVYMRKGDVVSASLYGAVGNRIEASESTRLEERLAQKLKELHA